MSLKIEVFHETKDSKQWTPLPKTSEYLTEKQLIPNVGDALTLVGDDGVNIGLESTSFKRIMTVKIKWFNYASADVAILLHYVAF